MSGAIYLRTKYFVSRAGMKVRLYVRNPALLRVARWQTKNLLLTSVHTRGEDNVNIYIFVLGLVPAGISDGKH
jgi:hypothetical protein